MKSLRNKRLPMMPKMKILFHSSVFSNQYERLIASVKDVIPAGALEAVCGVEHLVARLKRSLQDVGVVVLLTTSHDELSLIEEHRDLLSQVQVILILPDAEKETITRGHRLFPRFCSFADSDFQDIKAVLEKMVFNLFAVKGQKNRLPGTH